MKTVSPLSASAGPSELYKLVQGNSDETNGIQTCNVESENLISCNSELVSRIDKLEFSKSKHGPGHFIQKVFLQKLKSKSVPSLNKRKGPLLVDEEDNINIEPAADDISNDNSFLPSECTDNWFKTWPDCGLDVKNKENYITELPCEGSHGSPVLTNGDIVKVNDNYSNKNDNVSNAVLNNSTCQHVPMSMDGILLNLPIAYSPVTKQILILNNSPPNSAKPEDEVNGSPKLALSSRSALHRVSTEAGSFSSAVSSLSDSSPLTNEDISSSSLLPENGDTCSLISIGTCSIASEDSVGEKPKRKGISSFFSRSVFGWKAKSESTHSTEGWSLFGKSTHVARQLDKYSDDHVSIGSDSVQGSTGLIQLDRPIGLPEKTTKEKKAHAHQHESIISSVRKRELKEAKQRKKLLQSQLKMEDELANATRVWTHEILPRWPQMKENKKTQEMWWVGVPPGVRGRLWNFAITNDLNITQELYDICVTRAEERLRSNRDSDSAGEGTDRESSMELIQLDISRTFPNLCIFQKGGPYYSMLHSLLAAYVCYRPDVGYVQGMSFIAAVLILNMDAPDAFICFANILNRPCHRAFYSLHQQQMEAYYKAYSDLVKENLPTLWSHMEACKLTPDLYLLDWVYTVYAKAMNLDLASRVWDVFLRDGDEFLFRTAIGILEVCQANLLKMDFLTGSKYLTKLPDDLSSCVLFKAIGSVKMTIGKKSFSQILTSYLPT